MCGRWYLNEACALTVLTMGLASPLEAADPLPPVAKPSISAPVTLIDNGNSWSLDNGIVKATINKRNGTMTGLLYHGVNTMGGGGYWEQTPSGTVTQSITIDPAKNGGERAEIDVKGVNGRMDIELRYAMERGSSGVYAYGIWSHGADYPSAGEGESRYITKLNHDFNWISVDADRNMLECTPQDWGAGTVIHAKEQRILSQGVYQNSVEHKYSYNAIQYKIPAWGWSSTKNHIGIWFINPTTEYLSGGAEKMELVAHFDANDNPDPIILDYWCAGHYAGGAGCNIPAGEAWNKVIGPIFVYCNALSDPKDPAKADLDTLAATAGNPTVPQVWHDNATALWQDALSQAKIEKSHWPYEWVNGVDYPHKDQRGSVSGQLVLDDPQAATTKLPNLTVGLSHPDYTSRAGGFVLRSGNGNLITWPHDGNYYQFWTDGAQDGKFNISNVRPGKYTLHAFADGVLGEFAKTDITVEAGKDIDLGKLTWTPVRNGKQIWEIGYPNRNGSEFFKGDQYWLWGWPIRYGDLYPKDITYIVGQSDWHKDWFFEQVPHELSQAWKNPAAKDPVNQKFGWVAQPSAPGQDMFREWGRGRATTWTIKFTMDHAVAVGQATLRIALGGADGNGGLAIGVNGQAVGNIRPVATNAMRYNTDRGVWQQYSQPFDGKLLKAGENEITLTVPAGDVTSGVCYDYLRLELQEN